MVKKIFFIFLFFSFNLAAKNDIVRDTVRLDSLRKIVEKLENNALKQRI